MKLPRKELKGKLKVNGGNFAKPKLAASKEQITTLKKKLEEAKKARDQIE